MAAAHPLPFNTPRDWAIDLSVAAVAGAFLGLVGPFGSYYNDGVLPRVAYWMGSFMTNAALYGLMLRWTLPRARARRIPILAWLPTLVAIGSIPMAVATRLVAIEIWPFLTKVGWVEWWGQSLLITIVYAGGYMLFRARQRPTPLSPLAPAAGGDGDPALLRRVPPRLGRDVVCLQMEDHYVRIHTDQGSDLVLMPLAKAMAQLNGLEGLQVHRSWWVARRAVAGVVEDGRNLRLRLTNGLEAPVARANVAKLKAAGWIAG